MKKKVLKLIFLFFAVAVVFSSCLGDTENKIEVTSDFVCVVSNSYGQKIGVAGNVGLVASSEFDQYPVGTILIMGYKILGTQTTNTPNLVDVDIKKEYLPSDQLKSEWTAPIDRTGEIYPSSFGVSKWFAYADFMDRWLFTPSFKNIEDKTEITGTFYYDPEKQDVNTTTGERTKNRIILDVVFTKVSESTGKKVTQPYEVVGNLSTIRTAIENGYMNDFIDRDASGTPIYIKFRYKATAGDYNDASNIEDKYTGDFSLNGYQFITSLK